MWLWDGRSPQGVPVAEEERDSRADMATGTRDWEEPPGLAGKSRAAVVGETLNPGCGNSRVVSFKEEDRQEGQSEVTG